MHRNRFAGDILGFAAQVRLVFANCLAYNPPGDWARAWGESCGGAFEVSCWSTGTLGVSVGAQVLVELSVLALPAAYVWAEALTEIAEQTRKVVVVLYRPKAPSGALHFFATAAAAPTMIFLQPHLCLSVSIDRLLSHHRPCTTPSSRRC